jgi:hypothetical protein
MRHEAYYQAGFLDCTSPSCCLSDSDPKRSRLVRCTALYQDVICLDELYAVLSMLCPVSFLTRSILSGHNCIRNQLLLMLLSEINLRSTDVYHYTLHAHILSNRSVRRTLYSTDICARVSVADALARVVGLAMEDNRRTTSAYHI